MGRRAIIASPSDQRQRHHSQETEVEACKVTLGETRKAWTYTWAESTPRSMDGSIVLGSVVLSYLVERAVYRSLTEISQDSADSRP